MGRIDFRIVSEALFGWAIRFRIALILNEPTKFVDWCMRAIAAHNSGGSRRGLHSRETLLPGEAPKLLSLECGCCAAHDRWLTQHRHFGLPAHGSVAPAVAHALLARNKLARHGLSVCAITMRFSVAHATDTCNLGFSEFQSTFQLNDEQHPFTVN
eukprot:2942188-Pleurochrysis_carterae.AAC.1